MLNVIINKRDYHMKKMIKHEKRLIVEVSAELHKRVKIRALNKEMTTKEWLLNAISHYMRLEDTKE
jgi:hypothetical protein